MKTTMTTSAWVGLAFLVSVIICAAAWFLGVSPALEEANAANTDREAAEIRNSQLVRKNAELAADFERMPEFEAELAALRTHVPTTPEHAEYNEAIDGIAARHDVTVLGFESSPAQQVLPRAEESGSTLGGFFAVPMTLTVLGDHDDVTAFLAQLQTETPRLFAVELMTMARQTDSPESNGRPATSESDTESVITGYIFVYDENATVTDGSAQPAPADDTEDDESSDESESDESEDEGTEVS